MIRVNLLPAEYRKSDGPPVARVVALAGGALLVTSAMCLWGYVHFSLLADAEEERAQLEQELESLKAQAERSRALLGEFTEYQRRRATIEKVASDRILWSRKLDELSDVIHNKGDQKEYLVWLDSLRTAGGRNPESPISVALQGRCGGTLTNLSAFNYELKDTKEFFEDFNGISPPAGKQVMLNDNRYPNVAWTFSWTLDHKVPNWREKQGGEPKQEAPK